MLFNSLAFLIFLPIVYALYWLAGRRSVWAQNLVIIVASFVFYAWWDWRFFGLILFCCVFNYGMALALPVLNAARARRAALIGTIIVNFGLLGFFKYFNFFADSFATVCTALGFPVDHLTLQIILPVGISFHTFQTMSYTIDVYRGRLKPTRDFGAMLAYVCYFPQLLAGPIERATNLLPQFHQPRRFEYGAAVDGMRQMLWGFFKKVVVADTCASSVNVIFASYADQPASVLLLGAVYFAFQIYGDFSGYSDIAIGCSRLFGINLMRNFAYPYFSRDIAEFWRRWHISLTTWFRDYLYYPLGGSRAGLAKSIRNTMIVFLASGLWHGANWTFVVWGGVNAIYFLPLLLTGRNRHHLDAVAGQRLLPSWRDLLQMGSTFVLVLVSWVFFRAESVGKACDYLWRLMDVSILQLPSTHRNPLPAVAALLVVEWIQRHKQHGLESPRCPSWIRWVIYWFLAMLCLACFRPASEFIYFQF